jgi:hypothetical protein
MSFVSVDQELVDRFVAAPESGGRARLLDGLGNGLHAMAQPLTVLRGALGAIELKQGVPGVQEHYLGILNSQVARLCSLMSNVQSLLDTLRFEAICAPINLWERIRPIFDEQNAILMERGVRLMISAPFENLRVNADATRTELAFETAIEAAAAVSSRGDAIEIHAVVRDGYVELTIRNRNARGKNMSSDDRLNLSLAEASIVSQQGSYELALDPFCISFSLALHEQEEKIAGPVNAQSSQSDFINRAPGQAGSHESLIPSGDH